MTPYGARHPVWCTIVYGAWQVPSLNLNQYNFKYKQTLAKLSSKYKYYSFFKNVWKCLQVVQFLLTLLF